MPLAYQATSRFFSWLLCLFLSTNLLSLAQTSVGCDLVALDSPTPSSGSFFGNRVSINTRFAITSAGGFPTSPTAGKAYIYEHVGGTWVYRQTLSDVASLPADSYGNNVYIDETTAVVAAYSYSRTDAPGKIGAVYIYTLQGTQWVKTGFITNPSQLTHTFGWALAKSGTDLVIGNNDVGGSLTGSVFVYRQPALPTQPWALVATLMPQAGDTGYDYGYSVAIDKDNLIVGAIDRFTRGRSAAYFYQRTAAGAWQLLQIEPYTSGTLASNTVGVRNNYAVIGTDSNKGVRIYERTASGWQLRQTLFSPDSFAGRYGLTVAISNKVLLVGSPTGGGLPLLSGVVFRYELGDGEWKLRHRYTVPQPLLGDALGGWVGLDPTSNSFIIGASGRTSGGIAGAGQAFVEGAPTIQPAGPFCATAAPVMLQATATGGTWAGPGITNARTGLFDPALAGTGSHTITYSLMAGDCTFLDTVVIIVLPALRIQRPVLPRLTCSRDTTITLTATAPGGVWAGPGITNAQAGTFSPATAGAGRHLLTYTVVGNTFCNQQDTLSLVVQPTLVRARALGRRLSCTRDTLLTLQATPTGGSWQGPGILNGGTGSFSSAAAGPGRHLLTYHVGTTTCGGQDTLSIIVQPASVRVLTSPVNLCRLDTTVRLAATPAGGTWRGRGIVDAQQGLFSASIAGVGRHTLSYELGTGKCRAVDSVALAVTPVPTPVLSLQGLVILRCGQQSEQLSLLQLSANTRYQWEYASTLGAPWRVLATGNGQPTYQAAQTGFYRVRSLQGSCSAMSAALEVRSEPPQAVFVPNILTPNQDGLNDVFELKLQYPRFFQLQVFSRWGQEVFQTHTYGDFWTATGAPAGIYYYLWRYSTDCDPNEQLVKGWVEVVR